MDGNAVCNSRAHPFELLFCDQVARNREREEKMSLVLSHEDALARHVEHFEAAGGSCVRTASLLYFEEK